MKRKLLLLTTSVCAIGLLAGCSSKGTYSEYLTLGEYKNLDLKVIKTEITDDMIDDEIETLLEDNATYTPITDRAAEEGDIVNIDYTGTIDGAEFDGGSMEDFDLEIGSGYLMEDLESALGDVYKRQEYNDEFVASISDYATTAEYEEYLKNELYTSTEADNRQTAGTEALSLVAENSTFNGYPQELYDSCKEEYDAMNQMYAEMFGIDVADMEMDEEDTKAIIEEMVNEKMLCTTIAEKEKIKVSDEEYKQYLEDNYEIYGYASAEEYEESETKEAIMDSILTEKVQEFLLENAKVTEVSEDEYYDSEDEDLEDEDLEDEDLEDEDLEDEIPDDTDTEDVSE